MIERLKNSVDKQSARKIMAVGALFLAMTACNEEKVASPGPRPMFNQPSTAPYFLNKDDNYYDELRQTLSLTRNQNAILNINRLLQTPVAQWLNGSPEYTRRVLQVNLNASVPAGEIPVFVAYNIPHRDLGGDARGGMGSPEEYRRWIGMVSETIGDAPAVMILEPDALAGISQMGDERQKKERITLLRDSLARFQSSNANTAMYLDAGNSAWLKPEVVADLLRQVDPDGSLVGGISLNVSSRRSDSDSTAYADKISQKFGRRLHVMIDNSRNGAPNTDSLTGWCNVKGEHIGSLEDTLYMANEYVETSFVKTPGESDGVCGDSNKPAGEFDARLLLDQAS